MTVVVGAQFHGTWSELTDDDRRKILDMLADAGMTWVRIDIGWSMIQPKKDGFDPWAIALVDKVFAMAKARGFKILATFWRAPAWATGNATNKNVFPTSPNDYAKAIEYAARRWKAEVDAWEIWNEPNAKEFAEPPDPVKYAALIRAAYPAVKAGNPNALVVFGGPMFVDVEWINRAYVAGARDAFDVMAVHPYQGNAAKPPGDPATGKRERLLYTDELLKLMAKHGDKAKTVWFTEFGWSTHDNAANTPVWFLGVSEAKQAQYFRETIELVEKRYPSVTHVFWYTSRDLQTGRIHQDNRGMIRLDFSPKPILDTLRKLARSKPEPPPTVREIHVADGSTSYDGTPPG